MNIPSRRHRPAAIAIAVATTGLLLAACSSSSTSSGTTSAGSTSGSSAGKLPHTLVFSPLALAIPAMKELSVGVQGYAKSKGWTVQTQDPNYSPSTQQTQLNAVVSSGVAGALWIIAVQPSSLTQILKAAQAKGIPVLANGVPSDYGFSGLQPGITFDVVDYKAYGTAMGQQLGACINKKLGGTAEVLFSRSAVGTAGKADIETSAVAALAATAPKAKIIDNIIETSQPTAQTDIGSAIQGHPGLNAMMGSNDEAALGAVGAFAAAGKSLPCLTEAGGNAQVLSDVKAGTIYASVALQFGGDMIQSFNTLAAMQSNPKQVGLQLHVPQKIVTAGQ
jgi:ABC-type sugar transport system substrate-binding protein